MPRLARCLAPALLAPLPLFAQTAPGGERTILVLDGSGSMWGQIDGRAKISIAQEVVTGLLSELPEDRPLGLVAYGHRSKGDCTDIETLVAPEPGTHARIAGAVAALKPKGKTPMTDAVIAAAEALRYEEEPATVILVSDGIETCAPDPCAAARILEETGVRFTAHVVGFDVADPAAQAQLACLASETGGRYLSASTAGELAAALSEVSAAPETRDPAPEAPLAEATLDAPATGSAGSMVQVGWTGPDAELDYIDTALPGVDPEDYQSYEYTRQGSPLALRLPAQPGEYEIRYISAGTRQVLARRAVSVTPQEDALVAPGTAPIGATIEVHWQGGGYAEDYIDTARPGAEPLDYLTYSYVSGGNPLPLLLPLEPGPYEIRYITGQDNSVAHRRSITVTEIPATLDAPDSIAAGQPLEVLWTGPGYEVDYVTIARPGSDTLSYETYEYLHDGSPVTLTAPDEPGSYVLRYVASGPASRVMAERALEIR